MRKPRLREVEWSKDPARKWQGWNLNPGICLQSQLSFAVGLLSLAVPGGIKDQSLPFILLEAVSFLKWEETKGQVTRNSRVQGRGGRDV